MLNLLAAFAVEKMRFLSIFFKFRIWVEGIQEKIEARNESISLDKFLRISPRKINILKKTRLDPRELNEVNDMNANKMLPNLTNNLKSTTEMAKKMKKK